MENLQSNKLSVFQRLLVYLTLVSIGLLFMLSMLENVPIMFLKTEVTKGFIVKQFKDNDGYYNTSYSFHAEGKQFDSVITLPTKYHYVKGDTIYVVYVEGFPLSNMSIHNRNQPKKSIKPVKPIQVGFQEAIQGYVSY